MNLIAVVALAGAADIGAFLARCPQFFRESLQRVCGSAGVLGLWLAIAVSAARDGRHSGKVT